MTATSYQYGPTASDYSGAPVVRFCGCGREIGSYTPAQWRRRWHQCRACQRSGRGRAGAASAAK